VRARRFPSLRRRLFVTIALIVILSVGITIGIGVVLTRRSVESARLDDLGHQADLLAQRERQALLPFSHLETLRPYLDKQNEQIKAARLDRPSPYLSDEEQAKVRAGQSVQGHVTVDGKRYLFAARLVQNRGFVLLRPSKLKTSDWFPFVKGLLIAALAGAGLAALASFFSARAIVRPVRRVAQASESLAAGSSPEPVPIEGSAELAGLAQSFNWMADELARTKEAERSFLLSVSHELKTPLTAIRGYAEGLDEGAVTVDEAGETIRREAARLDRLIHDPIDLAAVAREAFDRYEAEARLRGVALEVAAPEPAPAVGDHDRVLQVVSNLVENALRSTPEGGSVRVRAEPALLAVEDTGRGLPPEDLPRAFERFYLYDKHGPGKGLGSGLGLAIVKELTEAMGGSVEVRSTPGRGTTFFVRLPAAQAAEAAVSTYAPG
jgi:two-component system sensor histidine kinase BaeS